MTTLIEVSNPVIFELVGVAGFGLYVMNYTLLTFHKLHSHDALYFGINLVAASCVLAGLLVSFNLASAMIQLFWVVISIVAIAVRLSRRRAARRIETHDPISEAVHVQDSVHPSSYDVPPARHAMLVL
ncbi:MAG: hypothetical protein QNJ44_08790 [Rhodobacter sp.]|nr:hypothetical protein [Rhodobacter sp.]